MSIRLFGVAGAGTVLAAVFVAAACSSFQESDGAADAADDTSLADAPVIDAAVTETSADAATFCAAHADAVFCADFETLPVDHGWTEPLVSADGVLELLDGGAEASPLHAAGATVHADPAAPVLDAAALDAGAERSALLVKEVATLTAKTISVDLDLRLDALPSQEPDALFSVVGLTDTSRMDAQPSVFISFRVGPANALVVTLGIDEEDGVHPPDVQPKTIEPVLGTWFHVQLAVDRLAQAVSLRLDGTEVLGKQPTTLFASAKVLQVSAGVFGLVNRQEMSVAVDNVVIRVVEP